VPRFNSRLLQSDDAPLPGTDGWKTTSVTVPAEWESVRFRNVLTNELIQPASAETDPALRAADVLATCPVALLVGAGAGD
jgi:hypothetical protein